MPAKSKAQQKLFGIAHAVQQGKIPASKVSDPAKMIAKDVKKREVKKFATTPTKGLPDRVKKEMKEAIKELVEEILRETPESEKQKRNQMMAKAREKADPQQAYANYKTNIKDKSKVLPYDKYIEMWKGRKEKTQLEMVEEALGRQLSVPEKHQLAIAYKTVKMPEAMVGVMGGMTTQQAKDIIKKLTGKEYEERTEAKEQVCKACGQKRTVDKNGICHQCYQDEKDYEKEHEMKRESVNEETLTSQELDKLGIKAKYNGADEIVTKDGRRWGFVGNNKWVCADMKKKSVNEAKCMGCGEAMHTAGAEYCSKCAPNHEKNEAVEKWRCPKCHADVLSKDSKTGLHKCTKCGYKEGEEQGDDEFNPREGVDTGFKIDKGVPVKEESKVNADLGWLQKLARKKMYHVGPVTIVLGFMPARKVLAINAIMAVNSTHKVEDAPRNIEAALDGITGLKDTIFSLDKIAPHKDVANDKRVHRLWLLPIDKLGPLGQQKEAVNPQKKADVEKVKRNIEQIKTIQNTIKNTIDTARKEQLQASIQKLRDENRKILDKTYPQSEGVNEGSAKKVALKNENGDTWYLKYIDPTHFYASINPNKDGTPYHIGQMREHPNLSKQFVAKIESWLSQQSEGVNEAYNPVEDPNNYMKKKKYGFSPEDVPSVQAESIDWKNKVKDIFLQIGKFANGVSPEDAARQFIAKHPDRARKLADKVDELKESAASDEAKKKGLEYLSFGRYGKKGKQTHKVEKGKLVPITSGGKVDGGKDVSNPETAIADHEKWARTHKDTPKIDKYGEENDPSNWWRDAFHARHGRVSKGEMAKMVGIHPDLTKAFREMYGDYIKKDKDGNYEWPEMIALGV